MSKVKDGTFPTGRILVLGTPHFTHTVSEVHRSKKGRAYKRIRKVARP